MNYEQTNKFDTVKIKADNKYLLDIYLKFNSDYDSRSGIKRGMYYSSKNDSQIPFNLYIATSNLKKTLTLEFSSKILKHNYPLLINKDTIGESLENLNRLGICKIDVNGIYQTGCFTSLHATQDIKYELKEMVLNELNSRAKNYRRYKWTHYDKQGITFSNDVKTKSCKEEITVYNKEKEIQSSHNRDFLNSLECPNDVIDYFKKVARFETKLTTKKKIMSYLNIPDTRIQTVLNSTTNPVLLQFDKIFSHKSENVFSLCDDYDTWVMQIAIMYYKGNMKMLSQDLRDKFKSRSGYSKRLAKYESIYDSIKTQSGTDVIQEIRSLLLESYKNPCKSYRG